jgi:hypothetical protein
VEEGIAPLTARPEAPRSASEIITIPEKFDFYQMAQMNGEQDGSCRESDHAIDTGDFPSQPRGRSTHEPARR